MQTRLPRARRKIGILLPHIPLFPRAPVQLDRGSFVAQGIHATILAGPPAYAGFPVARLPGLPTRPPTPAAPTAAIERATPSLLTFPHSARARASQGGGRAGHALHATVHPDRQNPPNCFQESGMHLRGLATSPVYLPGHAAGPVTPLELYFRAFLDAPRTAPVVLRADGELRVDLPVGFAHGFPGVYRPPLTAALAEARRSVLAAGSAPRYAD